MLISRILRTSISWSLLSSLILVATVVGSAAQAMPGQRLPNVAQIRQRPRSWMDQPLSASGNPTFFPTWSPVFPTASDPDLLPFRAVHSAVYDPGSNTMIVFGGFDANFNPQSDVLLDSNANGSSGAFAGAWSDLTVGSSYPPARFGHTAVYDKANNRMIVFGGCVDANCYVTLNDTWVLSNANGSGGAAAWSQLSPTGTAPGPRAYHNAVYDSTNNRMIVFSGDNGSGVIFSDVWVLTNANGLGGTPVWTQLSPTGSQPDALDGSTAVYDSTSNRMIVFSGGNYVNSVWTLSNANGLGGASAWTNLIANGAAGSPPGRTYAAAIYDPTSNRMTIYGGNSGGGITNPDYDFAALSDVWVLANANGSGGTPAWTQLHPKVAGDRDVPPIGRIYFTGVSDPGTNSLIVYGGESIEGIFLSTWVLSHANGL